MILIFVQLERLAITRSEQFLFTMAEDGVSCSFCLASMRHSALRKPSRRFAHEVPDVGVRQSFDGMWTYTCLLI